MLDSSKARTLTQEEPSGLSSQAELKLVSQFASLTGYRLHDINGAIFLKELIEFIPAVVFCHSIDQQDRCLFVSKSFEDIWGLPREALHENPKAWYDMVVPEDREFVERRFLHNLEMGKVQEFEYRIRNTRGELRYIHARFINQPHASSVGAHRIGFASDVTERKLAELKAYENSQLDHITGLANRSAYSDTLAAMLSIQSDSACTDLCAVFIDIDRFGRINDTLGHSVGDEYLRKIAHRIKEFIGTRGYVARVGGDEFALILTDCHESSSAHNRLIGLQQALTQPISVDGEQIVTTASFGVARYPADGDDPGSLMKAAELAMVRSKTRCRGSMTFYEEELTCQATRERLRRDMDLRKALKNQQFELYYQAKYCCSLQGLSGAEVLLRWRHPVHGLVSPNDFIPQLEDSGDIIDVGDWILQDACRHLAQWHENDRLPRGFSLAVNVSAAQLLSRDFPARVMAILNEHHLPPQAIELELTESAMLADPARAEAVFSELRAAGLRLAIDDFGTGYSSMNYLRRFHPDTLKIDRSFTIDCDTDETALGIVESMIQLGRTLNMTVVAEGIETRAQADCLSRAGCDALQGFLFSKPAPASEFEQDFLRVNTPQNRYQDTP